MSADVTDPRAESTPAPSPSAPLPGTTPRVAVVGGGIAGLAAACVRPPLDAPEQGAVALDPEAERVRLDYGPADALFSFSVDLKEGAA